MLLPALRMTVQPIATAAMSRYPFDAKLVSRFSLTSRFGEPYSLFVPGGSAIYLPRACGPLGAIDDRRDGKPIEFSLKVGPRDKEQADILEEINDLAEDSESYILCAGTGKGKTWMGCGAIAAHNRKALIVVPKEDLMIQWKERCMTFLGLKEHEIGIIQADKVSVEGKKVVIAMVHSLSIDDRYDPSIFDDFGIVLLDEVHRMAADTLSKCLQKIPAKVRLGLSATVQRSDGKEQVLYAHIGPIRIESHGVPMTPKVSTFQTGWMVPRVKRMDPELNISRYVQLPHSAGKVMHIINHMQHDATRNGLIGRLTNMAYVKGRNIALFMDQLDHIEALSAEIKNRGVPMAHIGRYVGGMKKEERERASVKRVLLATWGMFKEGTDIPWLDTAIFCTPRSDIVQAAGRVFREYPNKKQPLIIDLLDDDSKVFKGYANKRRAYYQSLGAQITDN